MTRPLLLASFLLLTACSPGAGPGQAASPDARAGRAAAPAPRDPADARAAATRALQDQRFYAPAGDSAIEHYLDLRALQPDDASVQLALLELLPYAVIASEQAIGRGEFAEARRLLALVERTDPQAPSLARLRDSLAGAEAAESRRVVEEAEAAKQRDLEAARLAAEAASRPADAPATAPTPVPAPATTPASGPGAAVASGPAPAATPPPAPVASVPAAPAAARVAPDPSAIVPRATSTPAPRYPALALRRRIEGEVTLVFTVRADGGVESPRVVTATPPGVFEEAALAAIQRWRFEPVARPVESRQVLRFRLPGREGT